MEPLPINHLQIRQKLLNLNDNIYIYYASGNLFYIAPQRLLCYIVCYTLYAIHCMLYIVCYTVIAPALGCVDFKNDNNNTICPKSYVYYLPVKNVC